MKAKEFKKYLNYALYVELVDLDGDFRDSGNFKRMDDGMWLQATDEEKESLWEKEVVGFDMKMSNISWGNGSGPKVLVLSVSNLTEEERRERKRQRDIEEKMTELARLTGREVILGDSCESISKPESITTGQFITADLSGIVVGN